MPPAPALEALQLEHTPQYPDNEEDFELADSLQTPTASQLSRLLLWHDQDELWDSAWLAAALAGLHNLRFLALLGRPRRQCQVQCLPPHARCLPNLEFLAAPAPTLAGLAGADLAAPQLQTLGTLPAPRQSSRRRCCAGQPRSPP